MGTEMVSSTGTNSSGEMKIYLLVAYFKGEKAKISKKEMETLLEKLDQELR